MNDQQAVPPEVLKIAQALVASGLDLCGGSKRPDKQRKKPYRVAEIAALLDVHRATVYRDIESGRLEAHRIGSGSGALRIEPEDYEKYRAYTKAKAATRQDEGVA